MLLFPGEVLDRASPAYLSSDSPSPKESIWALYCRSMLLWSFCNRSRFGDHTKEEREELAYATWSEAQSIYDSLDTHTCNLDTAVIYLCREYISK